MMFAYPVVLAPYKKDAGFHVEFPDLEYCMTGGPDLEDTVENARYAAYNWLWMGSEEGTHNFPPQSHYDDITLGQGSFIKYIVATVRLIPDND